jgi:hypothetical protein
MICLVSAASKKASSESSVPVNLNPREHPSVLIQREDALTAERHYTVGEIAEAWNLSGDKVRGIVEREPGVLVIGDSNPRGKRRYRTLRIPQSVMDRVYVRLSLKAAAR